MTLDECIHILTEHNKWRRAELDKMPHTPKELGEAIDYAINMLGELER